MFHLLFEGLTAVWYEEGVLLNVPPCGFCDNRRLGRYGYVASIFKIERIRETGRASGVSLLGNSNAAFSSRILYILRCGSGCCTKLRFSKTCTVPHTKGRHSSEFRMF
jgi:hypothetical protein